MKAAVPRIIQLEIEGKRVLGFDTGLDSQGFAQAKLAQFLTQTGYVVYLPPAGKEPRIEPWKASGVTEREGTMVVWGPDFSGQRLDLLISGPPAAALNALRLWIRARLFLAGAGVDAPPYPWPGGALASSDAVLFPPERLIRRSLEAEGAWLAAAEVWAYPGYSGLEAGNEASAFASAVMLYRIFSGRLPWETSGSESLEDRDISILHEDIREGNFVPSRLLLPGAEEALTRLIDESLLPGGQGKSHKKPPSLEEIRDFLGEPDSRPPESYIKESGAAETAALEREREQFRRKKTKTLGAKRFLRRNAVVLAVVLACLTAAGLIAGSIIKNHAEQPTTKGMSPLEVAAAYYGAFGKLDHILMEACVIQKAGKGDVDMVRNLFVVDRMRQGYEMVPSVVDAREWLANGSPPLPEGTAIFGIPDVRLMEMAPGGSSADPALDEVSIRASYTLFLPLSAVSQDESLGGGLNAGSLTESLPGTRSRDYAYTDELRLILHKGAWRIAEIDRREE